MHHITPKILNEKGLKRTRKSIKTFTGIGPQSSWILLLCCLPLFFLPKINLLSFENQTAGLRVDDAVLLGFFILCFWSISATRKFFFDIEVVLFAIVGFSLLSVLINRLLFAAEILPVSASFFYSLRLLEYFLFFYVGMLLAQFYKLGNFIKVFFFWNVALMLLQKFQMIGIFSVEGYVAKAEDRILGVASFGSEIGLLLNLLFCFLIYDQNHFLLKRFHIPLEAKRFFQLLYPYLLLLFFIYLVALTGARMPILVIFAIFLFAMKNWMNWRKPETLILPTIAFSVGVFLLIFLLSTSTVVTRSKGLFSLANVEIVTTVWDQIALDYDPIGRESVSLSGQDASWWMRIHKWCYALKLYWQHPESWLQGLGPGFAMAALDGGFLRILTELGLIGCFLYGCLFYLMAKPSQQLFWMMVAFLLNMIFFDVYLAYKPMSLLFLVVGYETATQNSPLFEPTSSKANFVPMRACPSYYP